MTKIKTTMTENKMTMTKIKMTVTKIKTRSMGKYMLIDKNQNGHDKN